jgi:predicted metalloprotease with PDZ domain
MYEGVTEYFAHLIQLQNGLVDEKGFFKEMRSKMNAAEEFGNFSMTEMSKRVMEDDFQKKYNSVTTRGR